MNKKLLALMILSSLFTSCKQKEKAVQNISFTKYPNVPCRDTSYITYFIKPSEEYLNLSSLENGVDSFEMRIYVNTAFDIKTELYLIKATKDSLVKCHYCFNPQLRIYPDGRSGNNPKNFSMMQNFSFSRTDSSFTNLFKTSQIDTFPTQSLIPNLQGGCTDGVAYIIEIAKKNSYRVIQYSNPYCYDNSALNFYFGNFIHNFKDLIHENCLCTKISLVNFLYSDQN